MNEIVTLSFSFILTMFVGKPLISFPIYLKVGAGQKRQSLITFLSILNVAIVSDRLLLHVWS